MTVKIVAFVTVEDGKDEAFVAAARTCVAASRQEPGVLHYDLWREDDGAQRFVFNELYSNAEAVRHHMDSDHFAAFGLAARDLAAGPPEIIMTHAIDVSDTQ